MGQLFEGVYCRWLLATAKPELSETELMHGVFWKTKSCLFIHAAQRGFGRPSSIYNDMYTDVYRISNVTRDPALYDKASRKPCKFYIHWWWNDRMESTWDATRHDRSSISWFPVSQVVSSVYNQVHLIIGLFARCRCCSINKNRASCHGEILKVTPVTYSSSPSMRIR